MYIQKDQTIHSHLKSSLTLALKKNYNRFNSMNYELNKYYSYLYANFRLKHNHKVALSKI